MSISILVVEDEVKISEVICKYLALEGYEYQQAVTGRDTISILERNNIHLIILDIMLPDIDGFALCGKIRAFSAVPIIMLTARIDAVDRLTGFANGADDYVCKPFHPPELIARVKAVLRRSAGLPQSNVLSYGSVRLVVNEHSVTIDGKDVVLTQIEFCLLAIFMANPHQVFSREELLVSSRGKYSESYERTIDFHIKNLRKKINQTDDSKYIKTIYGVGYRFD